MFTLNNAEKALFIREDWSGLERQMGPRGSDIVSRGREMASASCTGFIWLCCKVCLEQ